MPSKLLLSLLLIARLVAACVTTTAVSPTTDATKGHPFLYRIEKTGTQDSFLFGTIHAFVDARKELPTTVWTTLSGSRCFIMETNSDEISMAAAKDLYFLPEGERLETQVKPATWRGLTERLPGIPAARLSRMRPWVAMVSMLSTFKPPLPAMDHELEASARAKGLRIHYLESGTDHLTAVADSVTAKDLDEAVTEAANIPPFYQKLAGAYRNGDARSLEKYLFEDPLAFDGRPEDRTRLLDDRNRAWLPKITGAGTNDSCFIAVGAGHLYGEAGLIRLLSAQGYKVSRM